jgi:hypothetical protein
LEKIRGKGPEASFPLIEHLILFCYIQITGEKPESVLAARAKRFARPREKNQARLPPSARLKPIRRAFPDAPDFPGAHKLLFRTPDAFFQALLVFRNEKKVRKNTRVLSGAIGGIKAHGKKTGLFFRRP